MTIYTYKCSMYQTYHNWMNIKIHKPSNCTHHKDCQIRKMSNNNDICDMGKVKLDWIDYVKFSSMFEINPSFKREVD